jgi:hypothetical protein
MSDTDWTPTDCPQCGAAAKHYDPCFQGCRNGYFTAYQRDSSGAWTPYAEPCRFCQGQGSFIYCPSCRDYFPYLRRLMSKETLLEDALDYIGQDARHLVMDSLFCTLHNTWATLAGNKPEEDAYWIARCLYDVRRMEGGAHFDNLSPENQQYWLDLGQSVMDLLPSYCSRVAARMDAARKLIELQAKVERTAWNAKKP